MSLALAKILPLNNPLRQIGPDGKEVKAPPGTTQVPG